MNLIRKKEIQELSDHNYYQGQPTHAEKNKTLDYVLVQEGIFAQIESVDSGLSDHCALKGILNNSCTDPLAEKF